MAFAVWSQFNKLFDVLSFYTLVVFTRFFIVAEEIFFEVPTRISTLNGALTQSEFAECLGVNRNTVFCWKACERLPDGSGVLRMHEGFGADLNYPDGPVQRTSANI